MPHAALMVALTPHMSRLSKVIEEHIDDHPPSQNQSMMSSHQHPNNNTSKNSISPSMAASENNNASSSSPSRVSFSIEKKSPKFSSGRNTTCSLNAEVVIRGELETTGEAFEQLMWSRRFKVGQASKDGETIAEHRVCTVEIPEEIFQYAERQEMGFTRARNDANSKFQGTAYKVAPLGNNDGRIQPKKSDLFNRNDDDDEDNDENDFGVDQLPDDCTFHLMLTLEIIKDHHGSKNQQQQQQHNLEFLRVGTYEVDLDPVAMMIGDSTLLPVEMFGPIIEERDEAVDVVAFASVFAVIGDDVAAATHGDDSNPSLVSSVVALSMAAQYEHLVFNVFRPELLLYRQGMQMALTRNNSNKQKKNKRITSHHEDDHHEEEDYDDSQNLPRVYERKKKSNNNNNDNIIRSRQPQQHHQHNYQLDDGYHHDETDETEQDRYYNNDQYDTKQQQQKQPSSSSSPKPSHPQHPNTNRALAQHQRQKQGQQAQRLDATDNNTFLMQTNNDPQYLAEKRRKQLQQDDEHQQRYAHRQQQQQQPDRRQQQNQNRNRYEDDDQEEEPATMARNPPSHHQNQNHHSRASNNNNNNNNNIGTKYTDPTRRRSTAMQNILGRVKRNQHQSDSDGW